MKDPKYFFALIFVSMISIFIFANEVKQFSVYDGADLLSYEEEDSLNSKIYGIESKYDDSLGIYIATVNSMRDYGYTNIEAFAEYWYKQNDLGVGSSKTGILFILSMEERDYDICAYGNYAHTAFTDYGKNKLANAAIDYFKRNNWYNGFNAYTNKIDYLLDEAENGTPVDVVTHQSVESKIRNFNFDDFIVSLIFAMSSSFIIALIVVLCFKKKMNNIHEAAHANLYVKQNEIKFVKREDRFTHKSVHVVPLPQNNGGSSGSGGGTTVHSSGFSHSSGKF